MKQTNTLAYEQNRATQMEKLTTPHLLKHNRIPQTPVAHTTKQPHTQLCCQNSCSKPARPNVYVYLALVLRLELDGYVYLNALEPI